MNTNRPFHAENTTPRGNWVWVFGSDFGGRHSKGYAKIAKVNFGAAYGQSAGPAGRSYAIALQGRSGMLPMGEILTSITEFVRYAQDRPKTNFFVTRMSEDSMSAETEIIIAQAFGQAPANCSLPEIWAQYLVMAPA